MFKDERYILAQMTDENDYNDREIGSYDECYKEYQRLISLGDNYNYKFSHFKIIKDIRIEVLDLEPLLHQ